MESEDSIVPTGKQGWVLADDGTWYWGLPDGTFAKDEWVYAGGSWYLMDADGSMLTGKVLKDGVWYYLTSSGAMATGWVQVPPGPGILPARTPLSVASRPAGRSPTAPGTGLTPLPAR